jgi:pimeloyl-ACP methyl ester carboxylesterase
MLVLLVHGLGRTPVSLFGLASELRHAGHHTRFFAYSPTFEPLTRIVRRLADRLREFAAADHPVGLVGHSLGGLLLRSALPEVPDLRVHHLAMLGTPNRSPRLARLAWRRFTFRLLAGDCGQFLASPDSVAAVPIPAVPYTLIGGTAGPRFGPFRGEPNDGVVAVSEVPVRDSDVVQLFPVLHTVMMNDRRVKRAVVAAMMTDKGDPTANGG